MEKTYRTSEVAKAIGIHPNTVRLYEEVELISKPLRKNNGYRVFTDLHIAQFKLARTAFQIEVLQNGLREHAISIIKTAAKCQFSEAIRMTEEYITSLDREMDNTKEAIDIVNQLLSHNTPENQHFLKRKEVSEFLGITMDTLRNWEMNGLIKVKRRENGYRVYTDNEIRRLKIIRTLRCANYSLSSILRALNELEIDSTVDIAEILNTPKENEDIISVCDKLTISLCKAKENAFIMLSMLMEMKNKFKNPPL